jgi:Fn3 associated
MSLLNFLQPLAKNSPALSVNIYNKETYTAQTLNELLDVKSQIVSLELSKMPVTDTDLKNVAKFENLRRLNLNFTNITGAGLATLASLKHLSNLSLSGTKVNYQDVKKYLPEFENLSTLSLWKTELTVDELAKLQNEYKNIQFLGGPKDNDGNLIKLNTPRLKNKYVVFDDSIQLQLFHPVKGVDIRFTTDGSDPDSTASLFNGETVIKQSTTIRARAYKSGWLSSDVATLPVYRSFYKPDSIRLLSKLNRVHPANGAQTFFDHQLGTFNANSPAWANNWAGFIRNDLDLLLEFREPKEISSIAMNTLIETETSIYPPATIEIWGGPSIDKLQLIARMKPEHPNDYRKPFIELIECKIPKQKVSYLKIIAKPVMKLPAWHKNKDNPALLLVDEVLIN